MPAWSNQLNWVVKLGGNPLRLHCMPAWSNQSNWVVKYAWSNWSNWASSQWISTQFDQSLMPGRIGHHLMDFHPIQPPNSTDSTRHHLNGFPPNLTDLTRHNLNGFPPNLTNLMTQFNQASSQWISTQFDHHFSGFLSNLTSN